MLFPKVLAVLSAGASCASAYVSRLHPTEVFFRPEFNKSISYPRTVELLDGTILATASYSGKIDNKTYFPVFQSTDGGSSWTWLSNLTDQANNQGMSAQPALQVLPEAFGQFPRGTVFASGLSASNTSSIIDLYASVDMGATWKFISNVARGSRPDTTNGAPCIWEPFILYFNKTLGVFYSDQRDPLHGQKLAHQESADGLTWGPVVDDVAYPRYTDRPGMTDIAYIPPIKQWLFVHEFPGGDSSIWGREPNPVYYRLADSPFEFRFTYSYPIAVNGVQSNASPQVAWTSAGGPNGTIIVSDNHWNSVFTNTWNGEPDKWEMHASGAPRTYSRPLLVCSDNPDHLLLVSAGNSLDFTNGSLTSTVSSVAQILKNPSDPKDV